MPKYLNAHRVCIIACALSAVTLIGACSGGGNKGGAAVSNSSSFQSSVPSSSISASSSTSVFDITSVKSRWPVAFVLPWDDASSGITHQGERLNHTPAGKFGPLTINDNGDFQVGDQRIKFWGVNITGRSCFPSHEDADLVAARLAKFGVNIVRFHHMENHWGGPSLIDYSKGNSRNLDSRQLDRLDYFVSRLKEHGIYTNINLLTSREYLPADGLPESINRLDWKQRHVLSFVMPEVLALEKEHANNLLNHQNPFTGLKYAEDPAVAFVEINNENGLFQQYLDGSIDQWPADLRGILQAQWNIWLAERYASTALLQTGWGAVDEALGTNILTDSEFSNGLASWNLEQHDTAVVSATVGDFFGRQGLKLRISAAGTASWHVQFNQGGLRLHTGQLYTLRFSARANNHNAISVATQQNYSPWDIYEAMGVDLTDAWQDYSLTFIANASDTNARLNFGQLGSIQGDVYISGLRLQPGGELGKLPVGETLQSNNVSTNLFSERYTIERQRDWQQFLYSLEQAYWQEMHRYLKDSIMLKGLAYGTIVSLSPPSIQQQFGFTDGHSYWRHPEFPNKPWDGEDWIVTNDSMVNTLNNTLDNLANQRVSGMPFTVSEYQHAMPNFYAAEAPLLIGAYGAYQDWGGVYFFTYEGDADGKWDSNYFNSFFQTNQHPAMMANIAAAANLFRRGDVSPAGKTLLLNFNRNTEMDVLLNSARAWDVTTGKHLNTPAGTPFMTGLALDTRDQPKGVDQAPALNSSSQLVSDTSELVWDVSTATAGEVTIDTARTKGLVGYIAGQRKQLGNITVAIGDLNLDWATFMLTAQRGDFQSLDQGASLLAVATARVENTNMKWQNDNYTSVANQWGQAPTLIEVVPFSVTLPVAPIRVQAWALNATGQRSRELPVTASGDSAMIIVEGKFDTLWYEIDVLPVP